ncbi:hypothetical protein HK105_206818 [Polyrhizophydium stewartii]|uniref:RNA polymerase II-associated protein 1 n=1 Tax=Polyrhizophydium stewartii TaxID=2732419 RepID=A0ABR4N292_9FUNG
MAKSAGQDEQAEDAAQDAAPSKPRYKPRHIEPGPAVFGSVVSGVTERNVDDDEQAALASPAARSAAAARSQVHATGFPVPVHRSVWAPARVSRPPEQPAARAELPAAQPDDDDDDSAESFTEENDRKIAAMTPEQIEEAQREIMSKLDPETIKFLQQRRSATSTAPAAPAAEQQQPRSAESESLQHKQAAVAQHEIPASGFAHIDRFIDPSTAQPEKLKWMMELDERDARRQQQPAQQTKNEPADSHPEIRFDLHGRVMDESSLKDDRVVLDTSLYHHGDSPSKPGYSIPELTHLSKSTVPSQRAVSLRALARIIANVHAEAYPPEMAREVCRLFHKHDVLLHIRVAIDASHETVVFQAMQALAIFLGAAHAAAPASSVPDAEALWDKLALGRTGFRATPLSTQSLALFAAKSRGKDTSGVELPDDEGGTLASVIKLLKFDPVLGLLSTHLLVRIRFLLDNFDVPTAALVDVVRVLMVIARHSASSAQDILECAGLVDSLSRAVVALRWPLPNGSIDKLMLVRDTLRLFRVLCQSGRDATAALLKHNLVDVTVRYLTMMPADVVPDSESAGLRLKLDIATQVWLILGVVFTYSLGGRLFDEYRTLIVESVERAGSYAVRCARPGSSAARIVIRSASAKTLAAAARALLALLMRFRAEVNAGGEHDALQPFVAVFLNVLAAPAGGVPSAAGQPSASAAWVAEATLVGASVDLLAEYVSKALTFQFEASPVVMSTLRAVNAAIPALATRFVTLQALEPLRAALADSWGKLAASEMTIRNPISVPLCSSGVRAIALCLTDINALANAVEAVITADQLCQRHLATERSGRGTVAMSAACLDFVERLAISTPLCPFRSHGDWIRVFGQGKPSLLLAWTKAVSSKQTSAELAALPSTEIERVKTLVVHTGAVGVPDLLPGDEYLVAEWLNGHIFSTRMATASTHVPESSGAASSRAQLSRIFSLDIFASSPIQQSQALYRNDDAVVLRSLFFEPLDGAGSLPIRRDWMFGPIDRLYAEFKTHGLASVPEGTTQLVRAVLLFIRTMASSGCLDAVPPSMALVQMMKVFLLSEPDGGELFRDAEVAGVLDWAFMAFAARVDEPAADPSPGPDEDAEQAISADFGVVAQTQRQQRGSSLASLEEAMGGGTTFYQLYQELLDQFASVSFGARHFQKYLVLPLSMAFPHDYRIAFWTAIQPIVRSFDVTTDELVASGLSLDAFVRPVETDVDIRKIYASVRPQLAAGSFLLDVVHAHASPHGQQ